MASLPEGRWLDVDGIRTRYFEAGKGEPIVFIYGGNFGTGDSASSAYTWNNQIAPLSEHFHAITFDKLGQGETDNPKNDDYTMAAVVRHAAAFIRALKLPPARALTTTTYVPSELTKATGSNEDSLETASMRVAPARM
jgi:pimeloyl-ACP methyl ester carboxylesterase